MLLVKCVALLKTGLGNGLGKRVHLRVPQQRLWEWVSRLKFIETPREAIPLVLNSPSLCLQNSALGYYQLSVLHANVRLPLISQFPTIKSL